MDDVTRTVRWLLSLRSRFYSKRNYHWGKKTDMNRKQYEQAVHDIKRMNEVLEYFTRYPVSRNGRKRMGVVNKQQADLFSGEIDHTEE